MSQVKIGLRMKTVLTELSESYSVNSNGRRYFLRIEIEKLQGFWSVKTFCLEKSSLKEWCNFAFSYLCDVMYVED